MLNEKTKWDLNLIVPYAAYGFIKSKICNKRIRIYFYNHSNTNIKSKINYFLYNNNLATPVLQNVIGASILFAINLNYKKINLFGVEHSWTKDIIVSHNNITCWKEQHFYASKPLKPLIKVDGTFYKLHEILYDYSKTFSLYHILRDYANFKGCIIINHTIDSFIDAFIRVKK